jgi:hypothetical protein
MNLNIPGVTYNINATGSLYGTASYALNSLTASYIGDGTNNYLPKWKDNSLTSTSSIYDNNINVGIKTTSPTATLHLLDNVSSSIRLDSTGKSFIHINADSDNSGEYDNPYIKLTQDGEVVRGDIGFVGGANYSVYGVSSGLKNSQDNALIINSIITTTPANTYLQLATNDTASITINSSQYVGILTNNPSTFELEVAGDIGPSADVTYDIGTSARKYRNIYATAVTASLYGTSSWSIKTLSASYLQPGTYNITSSWSLDSVTSSYALNFNPDATASYADRSGTSSYSHYSVTSSYALNFNPEATASYADDALSASYAETASFALYFGVPETASYSYTSSWAIQAKSASYLSGSHTAYINGLNVNNKTYIDGSGNISCSTVTASLFGTSSWANNSILSNYATSSISASYLSGSTAYVQDLTALNGAIIGGCSTGSQTLNAVHIGSDINRNNDNRYAVIIGRYAGQSATTASYATIMGYQAGYNAKTASYAVIIGKDAGYDATDATYATLIGYWAGRYATSATYATIIGKSAGANATTATSATIIGHHAGCWIFCNISY